MSGPGDLDTRFRLAVGTFLRQAVLTQGDDVPWRTLASEFIFEERVVPLIGASGIWKPACLAEIPISIATAPQRPGRERPYDDAFTDESHLSYRYRGTDPRHRDNVGLRRAMEARVPLAYFHGISTGLYAVAFPVFIVGDDPARHAFLVAVDALSEALPSEAVSDENSDARRAYVTRLTRQRLHQQSFRRRVLAAYRSHCSVCHLHRERLLDAAHILPDCDPRGHPLVSNGLAMCKLHHAAFDAQLLGIRPDLTIDLRPDVLKERDGPMLLHGLQGFHGKRINTPRDATKRPDPQLLEERYRIFRSAS